MRRKKIWNNRLLYYLLGLYLVCNAATCEEPVDLIIEEPVQLVAVCEFTPSEPFRIFVSESKSVLDRVDRPAVYRNDAEVFVAREGQSPELLQWREEIPGAAPFFQSQLLAEPDVSYELTITAPGFDTLRAVNHIPDAVPFESDIGTIEIIANEGTSLNYRLDLEFSWEDDPAVENFYHLNIYRPISFFWIEQGGDTITNIVDPLGAEFLSESLNPDGAFIVNFNGGILIKDDAFDGQNVILPLRYEFQIDTSEELFEFLYVELRSVSKAYYQFHTGVSLQQESSRTTPLSEPVIIPSNIENGLGLFAGYYSTRDTLKRK